MVTILGIDGGGIKGLLPAMVLKEIRQRLDSAGEKRQFFELFDLISGTSTGALIALGLSLKHEDGGERFSASDIVNLYKKRGRDIFPPSHKVVHTAVQAFRYKYHPESYERMLMDLFGDKTLKDAKTNLLITSFNTEKMEPHCMKHRPEKGDWVDDPNYYMRDVARASSAAPTYFPPAYISPVGAPEVKFSLIDGAVFANNPAGLAYVEAAKIFPRETEFLILSLGTGDSVTGYSYNDVRSWGYLEWVNPMKGFPIGSMMAAGQSEAVNHQLKRLGNVHYFRININLHGLSLALDDASEQNLDRLTKSAKEMIAKYDSEIEEVCKLLISKKSGIKRFFTNSR